MPRGAKPGCGAGNPNKLADAVKGERSFLRTAGGATANKVVAVEIPRADELSDGIPEPARQEPSGERGPDGRFLPGNITSATGGRGKVGAIKLARQMGLHGESCEKIAKYERNAEDFRRHEVARVARLVGGGYCGAGPASIIAGAAMQRCMAAYTFDEAKRTGDIDLFLKASRLTNDSRQNLLAAHELCVREAKARIKGKKLSGLDAIDAEVARHEDESGTDGGDEDTEDSEADEQEE